MSSAVLRSLGANGWFQVLKQNSDGEKLGCCGEEIRHKPGRNAHYAQL